MRDRPQQADLVAEIDRESRHVVGATAGVGGDETAAHGFGALVGLRSRSLVRPAATPSWRPIR